MGDEYGGMTAREMLAMEMAQQQAQAGVQEKVAYMERIMAKNVLQSLQHVERGMDEEIKRLDAVQDLGDDELETMREERRQKLKAHQKKQTEWKANGHGEYREVRGEKDFFQEVKGSERVVIHFFRASSFRCNIVDRHFSDLAKKHLETKFIKINAEQSPFLVERLNIWMMPSIVIAINGKTEHTIVGLDEFGGEEDFSDEMVSYVLGTHKAVFHSGVPPENAQSSKKMVSRFQKNNQKSIRSTEANLDEGDDWWD